MNPTIPITPTQAKAIQATGKITLFEKAECINKDCEKEHGEPSNECDVIIYYNSALLGKELLCKEYKSKYQLGKIELKTEDDDYCRDINDDYCRDIKFHQCDWSGKKTVKCNYIKYCDYKGHLTFKGKITETELIKFEDLTEEAAEDGGLISSVSEDALFIPNRVVGSIFKLKGYLIKKFNVKPNDVILKVVVEVEG